VEGVVVAHHHLMYLSLTSLLDTKRTYGGCWRKSKTWNSHSKSCGQPISILSKKIGRQTSNYRLSSLIFYLSRPSLCLFLSLSPSLSLSLSLRQLRALRLESCRLKEELSAQKSLQRESSEQRENLEKKYRKLADRFHHEREDLRNEINTLRSNSDQTIHQMKVPRFSLVVSHLHSYLSPLSCPMSISCRQSMRRSDMLFIQRMSLSTG
jgi:hypothetical protein